MDAPSLLGNALNFEALVDALHDGVYVVDDHMRIVYWNRAAEEITGYGRSEVVGSHCSDNILVHVDAMGRGMCRVGCQLHQTLLDGKRRQVDAFLRHKSGHRVPVQIRAAPLADATGRIVGAVEAFCDDSARRDLAARVTDLEHLALLDSLTGMPNRRYLEMTLELRVQELGRYGYSFSVLMVDIDHFKQVNDTHGHEAGDRVLKTVAQTLGRSSRLFDVVGRWGGEEFLVVLSHLDRAQTLSVAERLRALVASCLVPVGAGSVAATVSIGARMAAPGESAAAVVEGADRMLYEAKQAGRNRVAG